MSTETKEEKPREIINVYSKSDHELGRLLSNFAHTPFTAGGRTFASVEGWWYWFVTGKMHEHLCSMAGWQAKQEGRKYPRTDVQITPEMLKQVYLRKLACNPEIKAMLLAFDGIFDHYYVYGGKNVPATKWLWTAKLWEEIRDELKAQPVGSITVVNKFAHQGPFVYIGRPSAFGNPFPVSMGRDECIAKFKEYMLMMVKNQASPLAIGIRTLIERVQSGEQVHLGCFCKPKACHGDVIAEYVMSQVNQNG